jgi:hypothetical protein
MRSRLDVLLGAMLHWSRWRRSCVGYNCCGTTHPRPAGGPGIGVADEAQRAAISAVGSDPEAYQKLLREQNCRPRRAGLAAAGLLRDDPDLAPVPGRWPWVVVDGVQDHDATQYGCFASSCRRTANICAIGDPDQSIYSFRGGGRGLLPAGSRRTSPTPAGPTHRNYRSSAAHHRRAPARSSHPPHWVRRPPSRAGPARPRRAHAGPARG